MLAGHARFPNQPDPHDSLEHRRELAGGQSPHAARAVLLGFARPPGIIYNRRLGEVFVVRNAGNVIDDVALDSIECAVEHLGVPLVVVLGHERCGAVTAALQGGRAQGHIDNVFSPSAPRSSAAAARPATR